MKCWNCGAETSDPFAGKLSFRAECDACGASLHCCRNCTFYTPGKPNACAVPGTDFVADRAAANLCEEFKILGKGPSPTPSPSDAAKRLFGDDLPADGQDPKRRFNALFEEE